MTDERAPDVDVVIPTRDRPELMARALASVVEQEYPGLVRVIVVHDQAEPDHAIESDEPTRQVIAISNDRAPGLAGARNTGILAGQAPLVAFCDDDDVWLPGKLQAQVARLAAEPDAVLCATSIEIAFHDNVNERLVGADTVSHGQLLRSRMAMLHSSTFIIRRDQLEGEMGLVSEAAPGSMCEDWDLLLRASSTHPVVVVDVAYVRVLWGRTSFFSDRWETKIAAHQWMLAEHPDILTSDVGAARVYGQLAFSHASIGQRQKSFAWARRALRRNWREPRAFLAMAVASGAVSSERVLSELHKRGHGV